jgi:hypothetical protein
VDLKKNEPKLADVRAPWDGRGWRVRDFLKPKNFWRTIVYDRKYKGFWAPTAIDPWRYRLFLKDLDEVCLRSLKSQGALTAKELANWLNREELLRTKPEQTGIHRISVATVHDWINLARRRGYVVPWGVEAGGVQTMTRRVSGHWELTKQGREAVHSRLTALIRQFPYQSLLVGSAGMLGLLGSFLDWLSVHQAVFVWLLIAVLVAFPVGMVNFVMNRSERRESPGIAVVAIETLRSAGKPLPVLGTSSR